MPRNLGSRIIFTALPGVALIGPLAAGADVAAAASVGAGAAVGAGASVGAAAGALVGAGAVVGAAAGVPPQATRISGAITSRHASFKYLLIEHSFRVRSRKSDSCRRRRSVRTKAPHGMRPIPPF